MYTSTCMENCEKLIWGPLNLNRGCSTLLSIADVTNTKKQPFNGIKCKLI